MKRITLVIGASTNPDRYSYMAIKSLVLHGQTVYAVGLREGCVHGIHILKPFPRIPMVHTVTMYVGRKNQSFFYQYILGLKPERVIFNPGSENDELETLLKKKGIEVLHDCTLVMLSNGTY